ncbi:unnamed protein product, partial [Iphiclides podalirius]
MCYLCNCLAWSVDVVQRAITFCLLAFLICIMCIGFSICIIAGIAYGYNYSMAEFITFTRSDVTVYMRRGQMNDRPDLAEFGVRRMSGASDAFSNISADYQEPVPSTGDKQPLSETLVKSLDTRKYAERLTKFSKTQSSKSQDIEEQQSTELSVSYFRFTTPPVHRISIVPNSAMQTTVLQSGSSEIIMRKFPPVKDVSADVTKKDPDDYFYKIDVEEKDKIKSKMKINRVDESGEIPDEDVKNLGRIPTRHPIPMRHFEGTTADMDDDNAAYRPI